MKKILIALDNSPTARSVIAAAHAFAPLFGAELEALHVRIDGLRTVAGAAEAARIPLRTMPGDVVDRVVEAGHDESVVAVVMGARGLRTDDRPLGSTAASVATALLKPVLIIPPRAEPPAVFRRVLVPLEGTVSTSRAPLEIFELARDVELDVLALHIHDERSLPAFSDQPQHEQEAWEREFLYRYCPWGLKTVRLETRLGRRSELVALVAAESGCDLIVLGWTGDLSADRAPVVRETLARARQPVLLVPVRVVPHSRRAGGQVRALSGARR